MLLVTIFILKCYWGNKLVVDSFLFLLRAGVKINWRCSMLFGDTRLSSVTLNSPLYLTDKENFIGCFLYLHPKHN